MSDVFTLRVTTGQSAHERGIHTPILNYKILSSLMQIFESYWCGSFAVSLEFSVENKLTLKRACFCRSIHRKDIR